VDDIRLIRELGAPTTQDGTFGRWVMPAALSGLWWYSIEEDWRDNAVGQSCIPLGHYWLERTIYFKKQVAEDPWWKKLSYETFEITGVLGRSRILVHPANTEEDVEGCVGLGCVQGYVTVKVDEDTKVKNVRKRAVQQSQKAFLQFMAHMRGVERWPLRVTGVVG